MKNRNLRCIVNNCYESGQQDRSSMFKLPMNPVIRQKWMENIGIFKDINLFNSRVCRRHFETHCLGKTKVLSWAVPTLFLGKINFKIWKRSSLNILSSPFQVKKRFCTIVENQRRVPLIANVASGAAHQDLQQKDCTSFPRIPSCARSGLTYVT